MSAAVMSSHHHHNKGFIDFKHQVKPIVSPAVAFARQYARHRGLRKFDYRKYLAHRALQRRGFDSLLDLVIHNLSQDSSFLQGYGSFTQEGAMERDVPLYHDETNEKNDAHHDIDEDEVMFEEVSFAMDVDQEPPFVSHKQERQGDDFIYDCNKPHYALRNRDERLGKSIGRQQQQQNRRSILDDIPEHQ